MIGDKIDRNDRYMDEWMDRCQIDRQIDRQTDVRRDLLEKLAHIFTEAEKPRDPPSASWRSRRASGIIQPESKDPKNQGPDDISPCLSPKA